MGPKKIKLKASVNTINTNAKKKKKQSTKLKLILADPHKYLIPTLPPPKACELRDVVRLEMQRTGCSEKELPNRFGVSLGMASSLRVISSCSATCVLISKSIKPRFIIQQIAYFSKQRNSKAPVFSVDDLEELSKKMFGVKSAVMAFGNSTPPKIADWIASQCSVEEKKSSAPVSVGETKKFTPFPKPAVTSALLRKDERGGRAFIPANVVKYKHQVVDSRLNLTGDFVSFSAQSVHPKQHLQDTDSELEDGHGSMLNKLSIANNRQEQNKAKLPKMVHKEYDKEKDFPKSYAKFKTLALLSGKNKNKKDKS